MADDYRQYWDPLAMKQEMPEIEKKLRDKFLTEYVKDHDAYCAALRTGYMAEVAYAEGTRLLNDPYVQIELSKRKLALPENVKDERRANVRRVESLLWDLALDKSLAGAARVTAAAKLCNIYDMDGTAKIKSEVTHKGGVMLVPGIAKLDDWEQQAAAQQEKLIADSAEDRSGKPVH